MNTIRSRAPSPRPHGLHSLYSPGSAHLAILHRWPTALGLATAAALLPGANDHTDAAPVIFVAATIYLAIAVAGGRRATVPMLVLISLVFGVFGALGLAEWIFASVTGLVLVVFSLIGVHLWLDRMVARAFAEWCAVFDLALGVGILFLV